MGHRYWDRPVADLAPTRATTDEIVGLPDQLVHLRNDLPQLFEVAQHEDDDQTDPMGSSTVGSSREVECHEC